MNRFLKAAIENMEQVETVDADNVLAPIWTQQAIAYALIAIAEALQVPTVESMTHGEPDYSFVPF